MNNLNTDILSINQKIVIPRINGIQYAVQKGDTLSTIAAKYGINDVNTILVANDMNKGSTLSIGRKLLLPNPTKDPTKKPTQIATKTPDSSVKNPVNQKPTQTQNPKPAVIKKTPAKDPQTITYGDYTLSLKVGK